MSETDILCVVPPFTYANLKDLGPKCPNLGLSTIAAYLEEKGLKVRLHDGFALDSTYEDIAADIRQTKPAVLLITSSTATFPAAMKTLEMAKEIDPSMVTIMGGSHVTNSANTALVKPYVDFAVVGEGEITALELCNKALGRNGMNINEIKGVAYSDKGKIIYTEKRPFIEDLNTLPMPAYHLLPMDRYEAYGWYDVGRKFSTMITSRGCPFKCSFCVSSKNFEHLWRYRNAEKVFEEMQLLYEKYKIRHIYFQDDEFAVIHKRVEKLCDMITNSKMDMVWECLTRVNHVDEPLISKMAQGGCRSILYGVELGYEEGLKRINKPVTLKMAIDAIRLTQKHKIMAKATFIMGFPWEGPEELRKTIDFAKKLDADITLFNTLNPYPGAYLFDELVRENLIVQGDKWEDYMIHGAMPIVRTKYLSDKELAKWVGKAYLEFYTRPKYILRKLRNLRNVHELKRSIKSANQLLTAAVKKIVPTIMS